MQKDEFSPGGTWVRCIICCDYCGTALEAVWASGHDEWDYEGLKEYRKYGNLSVCKDCDE